MPPKAAPALHTALRGDLGVGGAADAARAARGRGAACACDELVARLRSQPASPTSSTSASAVPTSARAWRWMRLRDFADGRFRVHFLSNVDGSAAQRVLRGAGSGAHRGDAGLQELRHPGNPAQRRASLRDWLGGDERLYAVSANAPSARRRSASPPERVLPMWDWVGGRYSLWSAVGFADRAGDRHATASSSCSPAPRDMDAHVLTRRCDDNLAVWHALTAVWNRNALACATQAVLPYDERLALLPAYLQQLVMESLGKSVRMDGSAVDVAHRAGAVGRRRHRQPAQFLPGPAPGHRHRCRSISSAWCSPTHCLRREPRCAAGATCWRRPRRWRTARPATIRTQPIPAIARQHPDPARCADAAVAGRAGRAVRAQRLRAVGAVGHQCLRPVGRRAGQADRATACCRPCGDGERGRPMPRSTRPGRRRALARARSASRRITPVERAVDRVRLLLRQRPGDVFAHHGRRDARARDCQRRDHRRRRRRIAQRHRDVAQPALVARCGGSPSLRCGCRNSVFVPREQLHQRGAVEVVARAEIRLVGALGELVPGADQLAVVAAEDAVADQRRAVLPESRLRARWSGSRCSAAHPGGRARRSPGSGRRRCSACRCRNARWRAHRPAAAGRCRFRRGRTSCRRPCRSGRCACRSSRGRRCAPARAPAPARNRRTRDSRTARSRRDDAVGQLLQAVAHQLVVVAAQRVARDVGAFAVARASSQAASSSPRAVVHAHRDHPQRARHQFVRARALVAVARHVVHRAVQALRQPVAQVRFVVAQLDAGDAAALEAQFARPAS